MHRPPAFDGAYIRYLRGGSGIECGFLRPQKTKRTTLSRYFRGTEKGNGCMTETNDKILPDLLPDFVSVCGHGTCAQRGVRRPLPDCSDENIPNLCGSCRTCTRHDIRRQLLSYIERMRFRNGPAFIRSDGRNVGCVASRKIPFRC